MLQKAIFYYENIKDEIYNIKSDIIMLEEDELENKEEVSEFEIKDKQ